MGACQPLTQTSSITLLHSCAKHFWFLFVFWNAGVLFKAIQSPLPQFTCIDIIANKELQPSTTSSDWVAHEGANFAATASAAWLESRGRIHGSNMHVDSRSTIHNGDRPTIYSQCLLLKDVICRGGQQNIISFSEIQWWKRCSHFQPHLPDLEV